MLCWFLLYNSMPLPTPLGHHRSHHQSELPVLYSSFPLVIYFTYGNVCVSMLLSQFIPSSPSPAVSTDLFQCSLCLHLYSFPANRFISTIFLDSIYMYLLHNIYFSVSSLCKTGPRFIHLSSTDSYSFLFMAE